MRKEQEIVQVVVSDWLLSSEAHATSNKHMATTGGCIAGHTQGSNPVMPGHLYHADTVVDDSEDDAEVENSPPVVCVARNIFGSVCGEMLVCGIQLWQDVESSFAPRTHLRLPRRLPGKIPARECKAQNAWLKPRLHPNSSQTSFHPT